MKKALFTFWVMSALILAHFMPNQVLAKDEFAAGTGTASDPYLVSSWTELNSIRGSLMDADFYYRLSSDLSSTTPGYAGIGDSFAPIGDYGAPFLANFDGGGNIIADLVISATSSDYIGLFGRTGTSSDIVGLGVVNANIAGRDFVGALVGENKGRISQSYSSGTVSGRDNIGGLAGGNTGGGLYGYITNSYSSASLSTNQTPPALYDMGGLVGAQSGTIINSYASGAVSLAVSSQTLGGLLGSGHDDVVVSSFWDTESSGINISAGGTGAIGTSTAQMGVESMFVGVGWDFDDIWEMNGGYPHLQWESAGVYNRVIEISSCEQLDAIRNNLDGHYSLVQTIRCYNQTHSGGSLYDGGAGFMPIGDDASPFNGRLNGNGYRVDGLYINRPSDTLVGLFGTVGATGTISKLGVSGAEVIGEDVVGVLSAKNNGTIHSVYSSGSSSGTSGTSVVGGLVGLNNGSISDAYSRASVASASRIAGGLVGENIGTIDNTFATGLVVASPAGGGLLGALTSGSVTDSFWDTETTALSVSSGGTGKTTAQLRTKNTYLDAGWDFVSNWSIETNPEINDQYAYLSWQAPYVLQYSASANGEIDGPQMQRIGESVTAVSVEAVPSPHYKFDEWSDGQDNPVRLDMVKGHAAFTANFSFDTNTSFSVNYLASSGGSITGSSSQSVLYQGNGTAVTAVPNSGYRFIRWSDGDTANPRTDTGVNRDFSVTASFEVQSSGGGGGVPACDTVVYSDWQACFGDMQFRSISSSNPGACAPTSAQRALTQRVCQANSENNNQEQNGSEPQIQNSSNSSNSSVFPSSAATLMCTGETWQSIMDAERSNQGKLDNALSRRLSGLMLLQAESGGRLWYLDSRTKTRHYINACRAYETLSALALGIKDADISKIPVGLSSFMSTDTDGDGLSDKLEKALGSKTDNIDTDGDSYNDKTELLAKKNLFGPGDQNIDKNLVARLKGRILIQSENLGQLWYLNPSDGLRYYLDHAENLIKVLDKLALGISNSNLRKLSVGK